jgi:hypothetical protein
MFETAFWNDIIYDDMFFSVAITKSVCFSGFPILSVVRGQVVV